MALPSTGLLTGMMIRNAIGETASDMASLQMSPLINIYSPRKPYSRTLGSNAFNKVHGLYRDTNNNIAYNRVKADELKFGSDWHGYDHSAEPSTKVWIEAIYHHGWDIYDPLGTVLYEGIVYTAVVNFVKGLNGIDPADISSYTKWVKPTVDGYGGLIMFSVVHPEYDGYTSECKSVTDTIDTLTITFRVSTLYAQPFKVEYAQRVSGVYQGTGYPVEHEFINNGTAFPNWSDGISISENLLQIGDRETGRDYGETTDHPYTQCRFYNNFTDRDFYLSVFGELKYGTTRIFPDIILINGVSVYVDESGYSESVLVNPQDYIECKFMYTYNLPENVVYPDVVRMGCDSDEIDVDWYYEQIPPDYSYGT